MHNSRTTARLLNNIMSDKRLSQWKDYQAVKKSLNTQYPITLQSHVLCSKYLEVPKKNCIKTSNKNSNNFKAQSTRLKLNNMWHLISWGTIDLRSDNE